MNVRERGQALQAGDELVRHSICGALVLAATVVAAGCGDMEDGVTEQGAAATARDVLGVRGFTFPNVGHAAVFRANYTSNAFFATGTPFGTPVGFAGGLLDRTIPSGYVRHDGVAAYLYIDTFKHIHEVTAGGGNVDLFNAYALNAPLPYVPLAEPFSGYFFPPGDVFGYVRSDNVSAIVYTAQGGDVIELRSNFGSQPPWLVTDLTMVSGATARAAVNATPYVRSDGWNTVVYFGTETHIHELASLGGGSGWSDADLSLVTGDLVFATTDLSPYVRSDGYNSIVFGSNQTMHEFAYHPGGSWGSYVLPATTMLRGDAFFRRPSGYVRADGINAVVYQDSNGSINELALLSNGWINSVLATPGVTPQGLLFGHLAPGNRSSILFQGDDSAGVNHRYELALPLGGGWQLQAF